MCLQKLPTAARDGLFRPEELFGGLAIREATAEVVSRGCCHSESRRVPAGQSTSTGCGTRRLSLWRQPLAMAGHNRVDGPLVYWLQSV